MTDAILERFTLPPRDGWGEREIAVRRESPFMLVRDEGDGQADDGLTLDGYAAVFNRQEVIDSWEGRFKERIAAGAMKKSFRESPPRIQFDHGRHVLIGSIPIASLEPGFPREEVDADLAPEGGAHVVARLHDNWLVQPVREAIGSGSIDGMSFRFSVVREEWHDQDGKRITDEDALREALRRTWYEDVPDEELLLRTLKELRVPELGPVVWPAYTDTSVGVRSQSVTIDLSRLNSPEEKNKLARAVLMADRAETPDAEAPPVTDKADEHPPESNDAPRSTAPVAAGEHGSAKRVELRRYLRSTHHTLTDIDLQKGRYSS